ncbi:hypothetical protein PVK06_023126 [Gossypium arboreum]|uniref:Rapid ALkalinization Factor n=1 Tax=Gossypium arboreum TaxID=29729 RepID=A0ABR0PAF0_GOSAR|nr:hypothetical protein PVK06_023126 [Gossypium arboreum]
METKMKKTCFSLAILVLVVFNSINHSRAISMETNSSTTSIIANDEQLEFLMDSHFSRILQGSGSVANNALKPGQAAAGCGRNPFDSCLPSPNRPITTQNCGYYTRSCGR